MHDVVSISSDTLLKPGMIITVEPGLYIPDLPGIPEKCAAPAVAASVFFVDNRAVP